MESFVEKVYPHLSNVLVARIARRFSLGKVIDWQEVPGGWTNFNIKITTSKGNFIVRFYRFGARSRKDIELECAALDHLKKAGLPVSPAINAKNGQKIMILSLDGNQLYVTVFAFIDGEEYSTLNPKQLEAAGSYLAKVDESLSKFKASHIRKYWHFKFEIWKLKKQILKRANARPWTFGESISLADFKKLINNETNQFMKALKKHKPDLVATGLIHGDFHATNLKFKGDKIVGIFDFNSLIFGPRVLDLAICIANLRLQHYEQGLNLSTKQLTLFVLAGYQKEIKLLLFEKEILPILTRFWLFSQFAWTLKQPYSGEQGYFYGQMFTRVLIVLKEKIVEVN